jgi:hypothetical protein
MLGLRLAMLAFAVSPYWAYGFDVLGFEQSLIAAVCIATAYLTFLIPDADPDA